MSDKTKFLGPWEYQEQWRNWHRPGLNCSGFYTNAISIKQNAEKRELDAELPQYGYVLIDDVALWQKLLLLK